MKLDLLDELMEARGLDVLLITSKHNNRYLLDGHYCRFFGHMDAVGVSRYLPILIYVRGRRDLSRYIAWVGEGWDTDLVNLWVEVSKVAHGSVDAANAAVDWLEHNSLVGGRIGCEFSFLPYDAGEVFQKRMPKAQLVDSFDILEEVRARKSPRELEVIEKCTVSIVDSMSECFSKHGVGDTKNEIAHTLHLELISRGLAFEYCLISAGNNFNRSPSSQILREGDIVSLDSGGQLNGYIGDVARMGICGEPDAELIEQLDFVDHVLIESRKVLGPNAKGRDVFTFVNDLRSSSSELSDVNFVAHGMGLIGHEAPRIMANGPILYHAAHEDRLLEEGMVLSLEAWIENPRRGLIKLEDTITVTSDGCAVLGDHARGWTRMGLGK